MEHQLDPDEYDMATIQEPYLDFNHNTQATHNWFTVYPKEHYHKPNKTRSIILINKRIPTNSWTHIDFASSDMMAFQIQTPAGYILCINMYNDAQNSEGVQKVTQYMSRKAHDQNPRYQTHVIWLGDFNRHHIMWDKSRNSHLFMRSNLDKAQIIINVMAKYDLQMILPKNVLTLCAMATRNYT